MIKNQKIESKFHERLELINIKRPDMITQEIDVAEEYGVQDLFEEEELLKPQKKEHQIQ
jgi:hypothetical protein